MTMMTTETGIGTTIESAAALPLEKVRRRICADCGAAEGNHAHTDHAFKPKARGFAAMSREKVQAISSKGGKAAHVLGKAHEFSSAEAKIAGRKGGLQNVALHGAPGGRRKGRNVAEPYPIETLTELPITPIVVEPEYGIVNRHIPS